MKNTILKPLIILVFLSSCSNQFAYKPNDWQFVTETQGNDLKTVYVDKNRVDCKDGICQAWVKMIFGNAENINFEGNKEGEVSGYMKVKRMDASVRYDCNTELSTIISYQLYDKDDKMMDSKWINFDPEYARAGTVHGDVLKYLCK